MYFCFHFFSAFFVCLHVWMLRSNRILFFHIAFDNFDLKRGQSSNKCLTFVFPIQTNSNWPFRFNHRKIERSIDRERVFSLNLHQITFLIRSHHYRFSEIKVNFKFFVVWNIHVLLTRNEHKFCTNIISSSSDTDTSSLVFASLHGERFQVNKRKLKWEWTLKNKCGLSTQTKTAVGQINFEVKTLPSFVIEQCGNVSRKCRQHADRVTHTEKERDKHRQKQAASAFLLAANTNSDTTYACLKCHSRFSLTIKWHR